MKKVIATICVLVGSTLVLGACSSSSKEVDNGPGFANERTAGDSRVVTRTRPARAERTFTRAQSK